MYLGKKKIGKILAHFSLSVGIFGGNMNLASAEQVEDSEADTTVIVNSKNYSGGDIDGNDYTGKTSGNELEVSDVDVSGNMVDATLVGDSNEQANSNKTTVKNVTGISFLHGGYAYGSGGIANYNTVDIYNSAIYHIHGGHAGLDGTANYNTVNFFSGTVSSLTGAGYANSGEASYNTLNIFGGTLNGTTQGGYVIGAGKANENVVNIYGGKITGNIYGGYVGASSDNSEVKNNAIHIYPENDKTTAELDLTEANLYAGSLAGNTDLYGSGNSLNIHRTDIVAKKIGGFDHLNFYLPSNVTNGAQIFTLTDGSTDLSNTKVNIYAANLNTGDTIRLIQNSNGIVADDVKMADTIAQGISLERSFNIKSVYSSSDLASSADEVSSNPIAYDLEVGDITSNELKKQTDILTSAQVSGAGLLDSGAERIYDWLPPEGVEISNNGVNSLPVTEFSPFAGLGGSVYRTKTSNGQKIKSKNGGLDVGVARRLRTHNGYFVFGPITDYGKDNYDSHLPYTLENGTTHTTDGSGNSHYFTAGIIGRLINDGGMYYEGSFRGGRMHTSFSSDNFLVNGENMHADYSASMPCYSGHVRIGWKSTVGGSSVLDAYGIYALNRVDGFTTRLSTGEEYKFSSLSSGRSRIGARLTREYLDNIWYSGLAWVQEFSSGTHGEYMGMPTGKDKSKGTSGLIELGWRRNTSKTSNTMFDASMIGWVGHQKGVTFAAKYQREL